ncbi:MAG: anti-anti-sigma factor [Rhodobacterales bacterium]|nr:MAG: anti-anti-sigma factor [Rhodobacterales bacterium]
MQLQTETHADTLIVTTTMPRIDAGVAIEFKDDMRSACQGGPERVVLDMSTVDFLDSSGLGAVVAAMKLLAPAQKLELAGLTSNVQKVFRLTRMDSVFTIHDTADAALAPH